MLAACVGLGICCLVIDVSDGDGEVPGLDGSAEPFVVAMEGSGLRCCGGSLGALHAAPVSLRGAQGESLRYFPATAERLEIDYRVDFEAYGGGVERLALELNETSFRRELTPARTFALDGIDVAPLKGLDGTVLWASTPAPNRRFRDELVRHKVLDLIGDLAFLPQPLVGRIEADRAGHRMHHALVDQLHSRVAV